MATQPDLWTGGAPRPQPELAVVSGDDVEKAAHEFVTGTVEQATAFAAAVDADVLSPLRAALASAADRHRDLFREAGFDAADPPGRHAAWSAVRSYRGAVRASVLEPLLAELRRIDAGRRLDRLGAALAGQWTNLVDAAPSEIRHVEPAGLFEPDPADRFDWRVRKASVRAGRSIGATARRALIAIRRTFGLRTRRSRRRMRDVPFARLAGWHVAVRLQPRRGECVDALCSQIALSVDATEHAVRDWARGMLAAGRALDDATHYLPAGSGTEAADAPVDTTILSDVVQHGNQLQRVLDEQAASRFGDDVLGEHTATIDSLGPSLILDCERIGTFMLDASRRARPLTSSAEEREAERRIAAWPEAFDRTCGRIELAVRLEAFRQDTQSLSARFIAGIERDAVRVMLDSIERTVEDLEERRAGIVPVFDPAATDAQDIAGRIQTISSDTTTSIERLLAAPMAELLAAHPIETAAEQCIDGVIELIAELPAAVDVQVEDPPDSPPGPDGRLLRVRLRQLAEQAWDVVMLEQLRVAPFGLSEAIDRIATETEQLFTVVRFNLDASLEELGDRVADAKAVERARELALNGFDRSISTLGSFADSVRAELPRFATTVFESQSSAWDQFAERIRVEDRMQEQLFDMRYRIRVAVREWADSTVQRVRRGIGMMRRGATLLIRRARELVRLGQSAVEGERFTHAEMQRSIDALSTIDDVLAALPLVYRRLFSFHALTDAAMLEGRAGDLEVLAAHYEHWKKGIADALVVTGADGNGRSSFINVAAKTLFTDADVHRVPVPFRTLDEAKFVSQLAAELGYPTASSFDQLAASILDAPPRKQPVVCFVERLEHLFLRTPADNGIIGAFLSFLSRTDSRILWIGVAGGPVWNYMERVQPTNARLVRRHDLARLTRETVEAVIISRHMRSGLPLRFVAPEPVPQLLRRKLGRAQTDRDRQAILREEYFDRLFRITDQNILLAIFYWLRSARIDEESSTLLASPIEPLSFRYLATITLQQAFTLKAFFDHATLSLRDHDRIFQIDHGESRQIFESLGNLLLIEPVEQQRRLASFSFSTIHEDYSYRVRPLVVHPVLAYLRDRNMID